MVMRPRNARLGSSLTAATKSGSASGATPDLRSSLDVFTCIRILSGPLSGGRCSLRRRAILSLSML